MTKTPTTPPKHKTPLYCIRTDAVLLHPGLPGLPITRPPTVAAAPDSPNAQFVVATALPPIDWPTVLSWYSIKQPRRAHIWPLRALLHLYLMVSLRHLLDLDAGPSLQYITDNKQLTYPQLMDQCTHFVGNFWLRAPDMILLALSKAKEPMIPVILQELVGAAQRADKRNGTTAAQALAEAMTTLSLSMQTMITNPVVTQPQMLAMGLTRRRVGILERSLIDAVRMATPGSRSTLSMLSRGTPLTPISSVVENRILTQHKATTKSTFGEAFVGLTQPFLD